MKKYSMTSASSVAQRASSDIEAYLKKLPGTIEVINVEDDDEYRKIDVDLVWKRQSKKSVNEILIEIKGDRYYNTGNYFFETISNESKNTPGCFIYTKADYIFYYFVDEKELHILPMPLTRDWFVKNIHDFEESKTSTPLPNNEHYVTVGRLVPRERVLKEVARTKVIKIG